MSRQFKFRAWHPQHGKMLDFKMNAFSFEIIEPKIKRIVLEDGMSSVVDPESIKPRKLCLTAGMQEGTLNMTLIDIEDPELKIMQYLGKDCKDIKGIEVCQDDIIKDSDGEIHKVCYDEEFGLFYPDGYEEESPFNWAETEIIGNIHQNPKLLTQENSNEKR